MLGRFHDPLFTIWHRAYFSRQSDFPENNRICRKRLIAEAGDHGSNNGKVRSGFQHFYTTNNINKNVLVI